MLKEADHKHFVPQGLAAGCCLSPRPSPRSTLAASALRNFRLRLLLTCGFALVLSSAETMAQGTSGEARINPELLTKQWSAKWIAVPGASPFEYGVYHFRRSFDLPQKPSTFVVHVTADNRYQLFVNGERVVAGPARGDLSHWQYETVDLARLSSLR